MDGGATWQAGQRLAAMLGSVAWTEDNTAHGVAASGDTDVVWLSSTDSGASWTAPSVISGFVAATRASPFVCAGEGRKLHAVWNSRETGNLEVFYAFADTLIGVNEPDASRSRSAGGHLIPSPARGMVKVLGMFGGALFDGGGRRVMELRPGTNDIRHLSPGVYFIRLEGVGSSRKGSGESLVRKVVAPR